MRGRWKRLAMTGVLIFTCLFGGTVLTAQNTYADDADAVETCAGSGAAGSLGWIMCPIMDMLGNASEGIYNSAVKPALTVEPQLFTTGGNNGAKNGWDTFRNIANGLLIILFLAVIFSQLTGVGIDNYGIKKILPKIIVAAILMNLSYWICVALVDVSNIVGSGIQAMFDSMANGLNLNLQEIEGDNGEKVAIAVSGAGTTILSIVIIGALVAAGGYAIISNPAILLGVLLAAIGVICSIFFLFILLSVREAAVVILTVLSPLAVVCYMLPNTKSLFDKWLKFFEGLLLVFPICGFLVGGGNYVSTLLLSVGIGSGTVVKIFPAITAMLVGIVPVFFIPTVLRQSFSAMGNLGAKITSMGDRVGGRLQGATKNSRAFQYAQERGRERQTRWNAGLDKNGKPIDYDNVRGGALRKRVGKIMRISDNNTARNRAQYVKDQGNEKAVERLMDGKGLEAELVGVEESARRQASQDRTTLAERSYAGEGMEQLMGRWNTAFDNGDVQELDAVTNVLNSRYGTSAASKIGVALSEKKNIAGNANYQSSMRALQQTMSDNTAFAGNMRNKASDAYEMISNGGQRYNKVTGGMEYTDMMHFTANNNIATDIKDWSTQSAKTLERAVESGALKPEMANAILNSTDPSVQSGIQSDPDKRAVLQAAVYNSENAVEVGPMPDVATAAAAYQTQQAEAAAQNELYITHEADAEKIGKTILNAEGGGTFEGYAAPAGFQTGNKGAVKNVNGHHIFTDTNSGKQWNATTGRYVKPGEQVNSGGGGNGTGAGGGQMH